jgi:hypothetical protein
MQTFIPLATNDFQAIAKTLDNKRLNKQALEGWQILMTLLELDPQGNYRKPKGWVNHPAVKMWKGHESSLFVYILEMVTEWKARGFKSTIGDKATQTMLVAYENDLADVETDAPNWMRDKSKLEAMASTHRKALLVKDYQWYSQFKWPEDTGTEPTEYEYIWPLD